jgi:hypothetical protein
MPQSPIAPTTGNWGDAKADKAPAGPVFRASAASAKDVGGASTVFIRDVSAGESAEELATRIAAAPRNAGQRVATMRELDGALSVASRTAGIDLGLLTSALSPPDALLEVDEVWEFERLLGEAAREIDAEADKGAAAAAATTTGGAAVARGGEGRAAVAPSTPAHGTGPAPVAGRRA